MGDRIDGANTNSGQLNHPKPNKDVFLAPPTPAVSPPRYVNKDVSKRFYSLLSNK